VRKAVLVLSIVALAVAALAWPGAMALDRFAGRDLLLISTPRKPADVELERALRSKGDPVAKLYGHPAEKKERYLFADEKHVVRPPEDPSLELYIPPESVHPTQVKTAYYVAVRLAAGAGLAGVLGLVLAWFLARKSPGPTPAT